MIVGVPQETKRHEYRVALSPSAAATLIADGHRVLVQRGAGEASSFTDGDYRQAGAEIVDTAEQAWSAELVVKVKEPTPDEHRFLRADLTLFTFLHLAADVSLAQALLHAGTTGIAYETVEGRRGDLPLLTPMSEVAGRMAPQVGAYHLGRFVGGRGVLLGGVPGVAAGTVTVLGGGVVGLAAVKVAVGLGATVQVLDVDASRLRYLDDLFGGRIGTLMSDPSTVAEAVSQADLVIGAVLIPGARAPRLVPRTMLGIMKPGSVIVDVAVDQGGCVETMRPTTHDDPTFVVDGIVHYGVANMPGAVPNTSTRALSSVTLPYVRRLARDGISALASDTGFAAGLNVHAGMVTHPAVGLALDTPVVSAQDALAA